MQVGALLLAGGLGTRLLPLTRNLPKPLIPVLGKPLLEHIIEGLVRQGITQIVIAIGYQGELIQEYFGDGTGWGCQISYSLEETPLGTGGAIRKGGLFFKHRFLVLNADILQNFPLEQLISFHVKARAITTIGLMVVKDPRSFGVVELDATGRVKGFIEKPKSIADVTSPYVNAGIYVMEPQSLAYIPDSKQVSVERETFPALLAAGEPVFGLPVTGFWYDLGTRERYLRAHRDLLQKTKMEKQVAAAAQVSPGARLVSPVLVDSDCIIEDGADVGPFTVLGKGCRVAPGARVRESVLWNNVVVGRGACVNKSVLGNTVCVPPGYRLEEELVSPESLKEAVRRSSS